MVFQKGVVHRKIQRLSDLKNLNKKRQEEIKSGWALEKRILQDLNQKGYYVIDSQCNAEKSILITN